MAHSAVSLPLATSAMASVMFLPFSVTMIPASSLECLSTREWKRNMMAARCLMVIPLQVSKATFPCWTASSRSEAVLRGTLLITCCSVTERKKRIGNRVEDVRVVGVGDKEG